ncbi:MAG TPA: type II 3-dehydroquinate dehydratase [Bacillales bacterium]|nr:type II 3-dehydroquinate dehydratase [Bacillales bacterium]
MKTFIVINGPNLNRLGVREPDIYGSRTLADLQDSLDDLSAHYGCRIEQKQSNHEGTIIDWIHDAADHASGIVLNAGAFTHYSYAIRDAVGSVSVPVIEVHISNIHARETFRHHSVLSPVVNGQIVGLGFLGYTLAIQALLEITGSAGENEYCDNQ